MLLRIVLLLMWLVLVYVTVVATAGQGIAVAGDVFAQDMLAGNWRSQFNVDLLSHIVLLAIWVAWRQKFSVAGLGLSLLCVMGGLFSLMYVLALSLHHKGNVRAVLLGKQEGG